MDHWFTVEALEPDTYVISEYRRWKETHFHFLCGAPRHWDHIGTLGQFSSVAVHAAARDWLEASRPGFLRRRTAWFRASRSA